MSARARHLWVAQCSTDEPRPRTWEAVVAAQDRAEADRKLAAQAAAALRVEHVSAERAVRVPDREVAVHELRIDVLVRASQFVGQLPAWVEREQAEIDEQLVELARTGTEPGPEQRRDVEWRETVEDQVWARSAEEAQRLGLAGANPSEYEVSVEGSTPLTEWQREQEREREPIERDLEIGLP